MVFASRAAYRCVDILHPNTEECAQQAHEADLAVENPFEAAFAFAAHQVQFGHTAAAARRLMRHLLDDLNLGAHHFAEALSHPFRHRSLRLSHELGGLL